MEKAVSKGLGSQFKKSSACSDSCCCVEVARQPDGIVVRDSKTGGVLTYTPDEWTAFIQGVKAGEFDITA